jgi:hypothetical protein
LRRKNVRVASGKSWVRFTKLLVALPPSRSLPMDSANLSNFKELYELAETLETPAHVSSLGLGHSGHLFVGSG